MCVHSCTDIKYSVPKFKKKKGGKGGEVKRKSSSSLYRSRTCTLQKRRKNRAQSRERLVKN